MNTIEEAFKNLRIAEEVYVSTEVDLMSIDIQYVKVWGKSGNGDFALLLCC